MPTFTVSINDKAIYGVSAHRVKSGIIRGFGMWEEICGVRFKFVENQSAHYHVYTDVIPLPGGSQARGQAPRPGNWMKLNSGYQKPGEKYGVRWYPFGKKNNDSTELRIAKVVRHEWGHNIGLGHASSKDCAMNINSSADSFCQSEIDYAISRYGAAPDDGDDNTDDPPKRIKIARGNMVNIEKGSIVLEDGRRIHLGNGGSLRWKGGEITFIDNEINEQSALSIDEFCDIVKSN